jgi:hypothetical protein
MEQLWNIGLFRSPYSGCEWFSGWPKAECPSKPVHWTPRTPTASRNAALCVDSYRPGWRQRNPIQVATAGLQPIQTRRCPSPPTQAGRFTIAGPSSTGPWTIREPWGQNADFSSSNAAAGRLG